MNMLGQWAGQVLGREKSRLAQHRYAARLEIFSTISQAILKAQTMFQIGLETVRHLQSFFQCYQVGIAAFDLEKDEGIALARIKRGELSIVPNTVFPLRAGFPILDELLQRKTVWRENLPQLLAEGRLSPNTAAWIEEGIHTLINIPIFYQDDIIGSLNIALVEHDQFSKDDLEVAKEVANQLGVSIQQARLHEATEQQLRELKVLYAVTAAADSATDEDEFLHTITRILHEALLLGEVGFFLIDEKMACLRPHPSYILPAGEIMPATIPLGEGNTGWVAAYDQNRYVPDLHQEPGYITIGSAMRSEYCVPLRTVNERIGVLNAESVQLDAFSPHDRQLLNTVAQQVAQAVHWLRANANEQRWVEQQNALALMGQAVTSSLELNNVLQRILEQTDQLVQTDGITILLPDSEGDWLEFTAVAGASMQTLRGLKMPSYQGIAGTVMQTGQTQQINQFQDGIFPPALVYHTGFKVETLFAIPLQMSDRIIGVMEAVHSQPFAFNELDYRTLQTAAAWASIAITNAHTFHNERQARQQAETLRLLANTLNSSLNLEDVLYEILQQLQWVVTYDAASIMLVKEDILTVVVHHATRQSTTQFTQLSIKQLPHIRRMLVEKTPIVINDTSQNEEWQRLSGAESVRAWLGVPLVVKGVVIGILNLDKFQTNSYTWDDALLVNSFANQAATAIENARLFEDAQTKHLEVEASAARLAHANQLITFLAGVALNIQSQLDPFGVQQVLAIELNRLGLNGVVSVYFPEENSLQFNFEGPNEDMFQRLKDVWKVDMQQFRLNRSNWVNFERLVENRQPVFTTEVRAELETVVDQLPPQWRRFITDLMNIKDEMTGLALPLLVNKQLVGALHIWGEALYEEDIPAYTIFASQVAAALDNARLFVAEQNARQVAETLQAANLSLSKSLDLERVLESMLNYLFLLVPFDQAGVMLVDSHNNLQMYLMEKTESLNSLITQYDVPRYPLIRHILTHHEGILVPNTQEEPRWTHLPEQRDVRCWMGIPLVAGGKTVGLYSISKNTPGFFTREHYHLVEALAAQAAVAIQNVLLYDAERTQFLKLQESQSRLIQVEKLSALGRLTASIAHEINNPIQAIQGCLTLAQEEFNRAGNPEAVNFYLGIVQTEIDRVATIVRRMRDFYRPVEAEAPILTDLLATVEAVLSLTNQQIESGGVELVKVWETEYPLLVAKPGQLKQVFLNIILNALEAMPEGGVLRIQATVTQMHLVERDEPVAAACLAFTNSGEPIPPHILQQVFEPFFTTKEHGSGLGLSVSYSIVKAHQGEMLATSDAENGTTFTVLLPLDTSET